MRRKASRQEVALDEVEETLASPREEGMARVEVKERLRQLLERLPARQRTTVILRIFEGLSFREVAAVQGISENAAKVNFHHALVRLKTWWIEEERHDA